MARRRALTMLTTGRESANEDSMKSTLTGYCLPMYGTVLHVNDSGPFNQEKWDKYRHVFGYGDLPSDFGHK